MHIPSLSNQIQWMHVRALCLHEHQVPIPVVGVLVLGAPVEIRGRGGVAQHGQMTQSRVSGRNVFNEDGKVSDLVVVGPERVQRWQRRERAVGGQAIVVLCYMMMSQEIMMRITAVL